MVFTDEHIAPFTEFEKAGWEQAAFAYHNHWGALSSQSAGAMLEAAKVKEGSRVLDIATGAGYVASRAAEIGAISTGLDFSQTQVELAQKTFPEVNFQQGDAQELPFENASFDAVVMGFGMNHIPSPDKAATEAARVLKPGGAFAFTVWAAPAPGEGFGIVLTAIEKYGVPNANLPPAPPYFRFADETEVKAILEPAGFSNISTNAIPQIWRHRTPDQVFDAFNEGAVRATAMLQSQPEATRAVIREVVRDEVRKLKNGNEYHVPVPAALSVGFKQI